MNFRTVVPSALLAFLAATGPALAEDPPTEEPDVSVLEIITEGGGIMMIPLGILSVVTVVLVILFFLTIRKNAVVSTRFMRTSEDLIHERDYTGLLNYAKKRNECIARITQRTLGFAARNTSAAFSELREVAEAEGSRQASLLSQRVSYLADIGAIAPMVGLLGTVIGMIKSFLQISSGNFEGVRQMALASGVSEALISTAGGLSVGIIAMLFYFVFRSRVNRFTAELESAATHILALLSSKVTEQHTGSEESPAPDPVTSEGDFDVPASMQPAPERSGSWD